MSLELSKATDFKAPSFENRNRISKQIEIIVSLLTNSMDEGRQITIQNIITAYVDWKLSKGDKLRTEVYHEDWKERGFLSAWVYEEVPRDIYESKWATKQKARAWFKSNLGAAIIAGKILAIPVITI